MPGLLPPAWGHPKELLVAEFRLQAGAFVVGVIFVMAHGLFRQVSVRNLAITLGILALIGLLPAQGAFWAIKDRIWAVYGTSTIRLGWGLWLNGGAWIGLGAIALKWIIAKGE